MRLAKKIFRGFRNEEGRHTIMKKAAIMAVVALAAVALAVVLNLRLFRGPRGIFIRFWSQSRQIVQE